MKFWERLGEALKKARDLAEDVSKAITANHGLGERRETVGQKLQDVKLKLQELESLLSYFLASDKSEEPKLMKW